MSSSSHFQKMAKRRFSPEEDKTIIVLVEQYGPHAWSDISTHLVKRTPRQCRERYRHYLQPGIKNPPWSPEDDLILAREYERLGPKWSTIREYLPGRTDVSIKNRWALITRRPTPHLLRTKRTAPKPQEETMESRQTQPYHVSDPNPLTEPWSIAMIED
jgi:hypothetical protein